MNRKITTPIILLCCVLASSCGPGIRSKSTSNDEVITKAYHMARDANRELETVKLTLSDMNREIDELTSQTQQLEHANRLAEVNISTLFDKIRELEDANERLRGEVDELSSYRGYR